MDRSCKNNDDCTNAYELLNIHKAHGYGLSGKGQSIAIMDNDFNVNAATGGVHNEFDSVNKITTFGDLEQANSSNYHGNFVSSIAAGNYNKDHEGETLNMMGVAYNANLYITDYIGPNRSNYHLDHWAAATNAAAKAEAVVQNNSWGYDISIKDAQAKMVKSGYNSYSDWAAHYFTTSGMTNVDANSVNNYITALDNFQQQGVIVWALSNKNDMADADISAGLPVFFPQLEEAWLAVGNIDYLGSQSIADSSVGDGDDYATNFSYDDNTKTYSSSHADNIYHQSAPCGQTAAYCLVADGTKLTGAAYLDNEEDYYRLHGTGTSFAAPQISASIALLAEAFPNHTPEQLVDRLLASANNTFFSTKDIDGEYGITNFGNGITHKYSYKFGHGIPDLAMALKPIGTAVVRFGSSLDNSQAYALHKTFLTPSTAMGDALQLGLQGEKISIYDGLDGEFAYALEQQIKPQSKAPQLPSLQQQLQHLDGFAQAHTGLSLSQQYMVQPTYGAALPLQRLFEGYSNIDAPSISYLNPAATGAGINGAVNIADGHLLYGFTRPLNNASSQTGQDTSLSLAYATNPNKQTRSAIVAGLSMEQGSLLNSIGQGAWGLKQKAAKTSYLAFTGEHKLSANMSLKMMAAMGKTHMDKSSQSLLAGAEGIVTNYVDLRLNKRQAFNKDDLLSINLTRPFRAQAGQMTVRIPQPADAAGNLNYKNKTINLEPSGQQLNLGVDYRTEINQQLTLGLSGLYSRQPNHIKDNPDHYSMTMAIAWDKFKLGLRGDKFEASDTIKKSALLSYGGQL
ncbi:MAG: S8 family serine peptidase [Gammaproteobacteria bacterium]|nr:S8 family serine peptidase [Gammaproteobacteria bacterium]